MSRRKQFGSVLKLYYYFSNTAIVPSDLSHVVAHQQLVLRLLLSSCFQHLTEVAGANFPVLKLSAHERPAEMHCLAQRYLLPETL